MIGAPLIIVLIAVAWLTAGGMAVRTVSRIWLRHWAERQLRGAEAAMAYLERPHQLLTGANAGVAVTLVLAGIAMGISGQGTAVVWDALALAGTVVLFGQLIPRAVARRWPVGVAPFVLPVLRLVDLLTRPIIGVGAGVAGLFVRERPEASPGGE